MDFKKATLGIINQHDTPMFIATLFVITRKQPKCPPFKLVDFNRGLNKEYVVHIFNGILFDHKKE